MFDGPEVIVHKNSEHRYKNCWLEKRKKREEQFPDRCIARVLLHLSRYRRHRPKRIKSMRIKKHEKHENRKN